MKKRFKRACLLLMLVLALMLSACGEKEVGGLGSLTMDDGKGGGVGTLGQPADSSAPAATTAPAATQAPTAAPTAAPVPTESYRCDLFTMTIPTGWQVEYKNMDVGGGLTRLCVFVRDPSDSNNMIFYAAALEPFFTSAAAKDDFVNAAVAEYKYLEWAPVISGVPSAEAVLGQWASMFTVFQAEGMGLDAYFKNYRVQEMQQTFTADGATPANTTSAALATANIPASDALYALYLEDTLVLQSAVSGFPSSATYYTSYNNYGIVLQADLFDSMFQTLLECKNSLTLSSQSVGSGFTADNGGLDFDFSAVLPLT